MSSLSTSAFEAITFFYAVISDALSPAVGSNFLVA